ncbi:MAG: hypothetical protein NC240_06505 [Clostridium sp.]|nr:hypothetical protein [Clostridium sp.]
MLKWKGSDYMLPAERVSELQDMVLTGRMIPAETEKLTAEEKNIVDTCKSMINGCMEELDKFIRQQIK